MKKWSGFNRWRINFKEIQLCLLTLNFQIYIDIKTKAFLVKLKSETFIIIIIIIICHRASFLFVHEPTITDHVLRSPPPPTAWPHPPKPRFDLKPHVPSLCWFTRPQTRGARRSPDRQRPPDWGSARSARPEGSAGSAGSAGSVGSAGSAWSAGSAGAVGSAGSTSFSSSAELQRLWQRHSVIKTLNIYSWYNLLSMNYSDRSTTRFCTRSFII